MEWGKGLVRIMGGGMLGWMPEESSWKFQVLSHFPSTPGDLNMGFLLILTQTYHHPTGHLLLITRVIGSEAWVEVTPPEQSEMSTSRTPPKGGEC